MSGEIKRKLDKLIQVVSKGNPILETTTKTKLIIKGLDPDNFDENSEDNAEIIGKINKAADEFNVQL
ncbi:MAG: hypothetical protein ACOCQG_01600 [Candidatus Nanoarchaeia archaeon]